MNQLVREVLTPENLLFIIKGDIPSPESIGNNIEVINIDEIEGLQ